MAKKKHFVRFNGKDLEVLGGHRIRGEQFWIIEKLGRAPGVPLLVLKQLSKTRYEEKVIHKFDDEPKCWKSINLIQSQKSSRMPFPKIDAISRQAGKILVVRDFISGKSLRWHLIMKKEISVFQAIWLYDQLVGQLSFLHRKTGVVHGDLAPENIIVSPSGKSLSLIDFGSSFPFSQSAEPDLGDGARESYQAPECLTGDPASRISEQFSAASIFYEMLTQKTPFNSAAKREFRARRTPLIPASEQAVSKFPVPLALWTLIDKHLSKTLSLDWKARFLTLDEWQEASSNLRLKSKHPKLLLLESQSSPSLWKILKRWMRG